MGNSCCNKNIKNNTIALLLVGLDNAGKSVTVKGLAGESLDSVIPTVGLSVVYLRYKKFSVKIYDLGGGSNIRGIWHRYFTDVHGVIFVVDSSDFDRLDEAKEVLEDLLSHEKVCGKPVLLLANKQDCQDALDEIDLVERLQLESLVNENQCPTLVESCTAKLKSNSTKMDPGLRKGYNWLLNHITRNYENLNMRVEKDVKMQEIQDQQIRQERMERLRARNEGVKTTDEDAIESFSDYDRKINESSSKQFQNNVSVNSSEPASFDNEDQYSPSSSKSSETTPQVYYEEINHFDLERPKSAVQIVKQQLELNNAHKRYPLKPLYSNKTAPVHLYGVRHTRSAYESRNKALSFQNNYQKAPRSASICDEMPFSTVLPNSVGTCDAHESEIDRELFHLNNFHKSQKLPPLLFSKKSVPTWQSRTNGISVIDI